MIKCEITNREFKTLKGLSVHITKKLNGIITKKDYYDKYLKNDEEGTCYFCKEEAVFLNISKGYHRICKSKVCVGKTRATGTVEFLMYKYNISEDEALKIQKERADLRGAKIKESFDEKLKNNPKYNHERSPKTVDFWLKKEYSIEDAQKEVNKRMISMYETSAKNRRDNPEKYKASYNTNIEYYLNQGMPQEDAEFALKERQAVGRLDKFIERYGEVEGEKKWIERQNTWRKTLKDNNMLIPGTKKVKGSVVGNYSKISQELFKEIEKAFPDNNFYYATKNSEYFISLKGNVFYIYDFCDRDNNKIIEFNGDLYHANPEIFESTDTPNPFIKDLTANEIWKKDEIKLKAAKDKGFEVLIIWEKDYKQNKEKVIQECIEFIKSNKK